MSKHTPGPWQCAALPSIPMLSVFVYDGDDDEGHMSALPVTDANARLIAAAPDLLAALQEALRAFAFDDEGPVWADSTIAKARAAIAKATKK